MNKNFNDSINEFKKYVEQYDMNNPMISRKFYHTLRVTDYAVELAKSENCNEEDIYIAFLCGLLHDIARFKQATEFNTFSDLRSFDHGDMAYTILTENNYLSNYIQDEESKTIILKAVKNHNKYSIEDGLNERELFFAKITRDADKLDILDLIKNDITDNSTIVDEKILQAVKEHRLFRNDKLERNNVSELTKCTCLVFDIYFKRSYEIIKEKRLIQNKLDILSKHIDSETLKIITDNINSIFN